MKAMLLRRIAPVETAPLELVDLPTPEPGPGEVRIRVRCCAVCRTDLHVIEGDLPQQKMPIIPGHQIVGTIDKLGPPLAASPAGNPLWHEPLWHGSRPCHPRNRRSAWHGRETVPQRRRERRHSSNSASGSAWLGCGIRAVSARFAPADKKTSASRPASPAITPTADTPSTPSPRPISSIPCPKNRPLSPWERARGEGLRGPGTPPALTLTLSQGERGLAALSDVEAAPLLCAGIIGYRALQRCNLPPGGRLALYGFGSSAHVVIQIALHRGCEVYVVTRGENHRELARRMGAAWVGENAADMPVKVDSAIMFAPAGELVLPALESLRKGGTLSLAGIYMTPIPAMDYQRYVFYERDIHSVTCNTRADGRELLAEAAAIPIRPHTTVYPLAEANRALAGPEGRPHQRHGGAGNCRGMRDEGLGIGDWAAPCSHAPRGNTLSATLCVARAAKRCLPGGQVSKVEFPVKPG